MKDLFLILIITVSSISFSKNIERKPVSIKSFDGFNLDTLVELPNGLSKKDVKKVFIFVHGSGPQNLDEDLSSVTVPKGTTNYFFRDVADVLLKKEIVTVRYNKRSFEVKKRVEADPKYKETEEVKKFSETPLEYLIKDASNFVDYSRTEFPNAQIFILGHSEGTGIALNVAKRNKNVSGVVLIGFSNEPITSALLEQFVYRAQGYFRKLDINKDEVLDAKEIKANNDLARSISKQMEILDLNKDGTISLSEFNAGNYSNSVLHDDFYDRNYQLDFAKLPRPSTIISEAAFKVLFLQGEYDNQTPAYYAQSIDLVNRVAWKKQNLKFVFFPKAGHALDPRDSFEDINYRLVPAETLHKIAKEIFEFL